MVNVLQQGPDPMQSALGGLLPALMQQMGQQNQQQQLMSILGGQGMGMLGGGQGNDQIQQIMKIAQDAGISDSEEFKALLMQSGLFGNGQSSPQSPGSLLQALGGGLSDFIANNLPGSVI